MFIKIDVAGCADSLFKDETFIHNLKLVLAEVTYQPSPKQIVFFKLLFSYYKQYY